MASSTLRVGFIGAGFVNFGGGEGPWDHASRLERFAEVHVVGIADPDQARAGRQLEQRLHGAYGKVYSACRTYAQWWEMLDAVELDAVIIGMPPGAHGKIEGPEAVEMTCAQRGIHMLIEKPVSIADPQQVNGIAAALSQAKAHNGNPLIVSVGYMLRYLNVVEHLRQLLQHGTDAGRPPCIFNARYAAAYPFILSPSFWDRRRSGGAIIEQATHFVDLARFLLGEIDLKSVLAHQIAADDPLGSLQRMPSGPTGVSIESGLPEVARIPRATIAQWRFASGALGTLTHALLQHGKAYDTELEVWSDGLRATLRDPYSVECRLDLRVGEMRTSSSPVDGTNDPYYTEMEAFLRAIRENRPELVRSPYADAAKTYEATWAITQAAR